MIEIQVGSTITNGSSAGRVLERVEKDRTWNTSGWRIVNISLEQFGGNTGMTNFVPDYLLAGWRHVPFEWSPVTGGGLEERYVWSADWTRLQREVRKAPNVMPTVDGIRGHRIDIVEEDEMRRWPALHAGDLLLDVSQLPVSDLCDNPALARSVERVTAALDDDGVISAFSSFAGE